MVEILDLVGMLSRVRRTALARYVRRQVRLDELYQHVRGDRALAAQLRGVGRRLHGRDQLAVLAAAHRFDTLCSDESMAWVRGADVQRRFLAAHRLTPLSRAKG